MRATAIATGTVALLVLATTEACSSEDDGVTGGATGGFF